MLGAGKKKVNDRISPLKEMSVPYYMVSAKTGEPGVLMRQCEYPAKMNK